MMRAHAPLGLANTEMVRPRSLADACEALARAHAEGRRCCLLAGGTDFVVDRHLLSVQRASTLDVVVDLTCVEELTRIREEIGSDGSPRLVLGGAVTYWQLRTDPRAVRVLPILADMAKDVGAVQIQTRGTLAGNIATASPAADAVPVLMALEGVVTLVRHGATPRQVLLDDFFTGYRQTVLRTDEIISEIALRVPADIRPRAYIHWRKVGTRLAQAISKIALASVIEIEDGIVTRARFGMASVAPVTHPLREVRAAVAGRATVELTREEIHAAVARDVQPIDDVRSNAEYRLHVAKALVWRAFQH
jgi:CO/xanthine dehydrogenase FAD-binding subunit